MPLEERLLNELNERRRKGNLRSLSGSNNLMDFVSNDYLGLARSEVLHQQISNEVNKIKINGSTGSRLLSGNSNLINEIESELTSVLKVESVLLFNSGYMANLGVLSSIPKRGDTIIYDELSHACIKDGARLSLATRYSFKHNDLNDLEKKIKNSTGQVFIVVESVYSMDGDVCPIVNLCELADQYDAKIIVDEAHGTGVLGENGNGLSGNLHSKSIFCRIYTFGKAMGIHGAAVTGNQSVINYLINYSRPLIYTTAPSPYDVISIRQAFRFLIDNISLQEQIKERVNYFTQQFESKLAHLLSRTNSNHPIQGVIIPGNKKVKEIAANLNNKGYDVRPILSPTIKEGQERLRICLHTFNTNEEISTLIEEMNNQL